MAKRRVTLELDDDAIRALDSLASRIAMGGLGGLARAGARNVAPGRVEERVGSVLSYLVWCCQDGVRRPGSWEALWLLQAFGPPADSEEPPKRGG